MGVASYMPLERMMCEGIIGISRISRYLDMEFDSQQPEDPSGPR